MRINYGTSVGKLASAFVVVGYDEIHAKRSSVFYLCRRRNSRINGNYQTNAVIVESIYSRTGNAVALALSLRYLDAYVCAKLSEIKIEHTYRRHSVNVVISVDAYFFSVFNSLKNSFDRLVHILEQIRIVEVCLLKAKELLSGICASVSSVIKQYREKLTPAKL